MRPPPVPLIPVPLESVPVIWPKAALVRLLPGLENCAVLVALNASHRNSNFTRSVTRKVLLTEALS